MTSTHTSDQTQARTGAPTDHQTVDRSTDHERSPSATLTPSVVIAAAAVGGVALGVTNQLVGLLLPYPAGLLGGSLLAWGVIAAVVVWGVAPRVEPRHRALVRSVAMAVLVVAVTLTGLHVVGAFVHVLGQGATALVLGAGIS